MFSSFFYICFSLCRKGTANKVERTALKVHTPIRSTALMARSLALPDDSSRAIQLTDCISTNLPGSEKKRKDRKL